MEKKILYSIIIVLIAYSTSLKLNFNKKMDVINKDLKKVKENYSDSYDLMKSIRIEEDLRGKNLDEIIMLDYKDQISTLDDIFGKGFGTYNLIMLTSFESCSTCRDQVLKTWSSLYDRGANKSNIILFAEERELNSSDVRKVSAYLKGMYVKIPFYLNVDSTLFSKLEISPEQTPLFLIVDGNKKIVSVNHFSESTMKRVVKFLDFFKSLD